MDLSTNETPGKKIKKRKYIIEDVVSLDASKCEPLMLNFTNGTPNSDANLTAKLYQPKEGKKRKCNRVVVVNGGDLKYAGKQTGHQGVHSKYLSEDCYIGAVDKDTGKVKLIQITNITTKPILRSNNQLEESSKESNRSYMDQQMEIAHKFGGKKTKEALRKKLQYSIDEQNMTTVVDRAVNVVHTREEDLEDATPTSFLEHLPPCNREATTQDDIYNLDDLIHPMMMERLLAIVETITEEELNSIKSPIFQLLVASSKLKGDGDSQTTNIAIALYVYFLMDFLRLRQYELSKGEILHCPREVYKYILKDFTEKSNFRIFRSDTLVDKAICYIFILAMMVNFYEVETNTILYSVKVDDRKFRTLMNYIGATKKNDGTIYSLKLPIPPIHKVRLKKGKK